MLRQTTSTLSPEEELQYSRHLLLPDFGKTRQLKLKGSRVLLAGAGGLGCPAGLYLAGAGVGTIGVADFDTVDRSNLHRQIAHRADRIGQPKVESLINAMRALNPLPDYRSHPYRLDAANVAETIADYDLVLDGSDNFVTRYLLTDACYLSGIPLLHGAVHGYEARLSLFTPGGGACYRCIFREAPGKNALPPCAEAGVLGVVPGTAGLMMATEAIKFLSGLPVSIQGVLLIYDALHQDIRRITLSRDADCPLCGNQPSIRAIRETVASCQSPAGISGSSGEVQASALGDSLAAESARRFLTEGALPLDVREWHEYSRQRLPDAVHMPLSRLRAGELPPIADHNARLLVYCRQGARSVEALQWLRRSGYANAFNLEGGLLAWDGAMDEQPILPA